MGAKRDITKDYDLQRANDVRQLANHPRPTPYYQRLYRGLSLGIYVGRRGVTWRARFYDENGKKIEEVFPAAQNWREATEAAAQFVAGVESGDHQNRIEKAQAKVARVSTLQDHWDEYLAGMTEEKGGEDSPRGRKYFRQQNNQARRWLKLIGHLKPAQLDAPRFKKVQRELEANGLRPESVNRATRSLRSVLNRCHNQGLLDSTWWKEVKDLPENSRTKKAKIYKRWSAEQRQAFIDKAAEDDPHLADMCRFLRAFGARPSEASRAKVGDVDLEEQVLVLTDFKGNGGMKQHREFPLRNGRLEMLRQLVEGRAADEPLLPTKGGRHFGENYLGRRHREVANALGMPSHFDCYSWRHCWHLEMLDAGIRIDRIAKLAGNSPQYILKNYSAGDDRVADDLPEAV